MDKTTDIISLSGFVTYIIPILLSSSVISALVSWLTTTLLKKLEFKNYI